MDYYRNGKKYELSAIYEKGQVGQIIVLANVTFEAGNQLHELKQPCFFIITAKSDTGYTATDGKGNNYEVSFYDAWYFYDAYLWSQFQAGKQAAKDEKKNRQIQDLELRLNLLKEILANSPKEAATRAEAIVAETKKRVLEDLKKGT